MLRPLSTIPSLEKRNHCSINVYQLENTTLVSVYHSENRKGRYKNDPLCLVENKDSHYCLNKNISNLLHFPSRSKSKQNKAPKSRFFKIVPNPLSKKLRRECILLRKQCPTWELNASRFSHTWVCELREDSKVPVRCACWSGSNQCGYTKFIPSQFSD